MKIGMCRSIDDVDSFAIGKKAGVDFLEISFDDLEDFTEEQIKDFKCKLDECGLECYSAKNFLPGTFKIVGENVDYEALGAYLDRCFKKAAILGMKLVVFGSGGARKYEENTPYETAYSQLIKFTTEYVAPGAKAYGITVVFEPLNSAETNLIHTVEDGVKAARDCGCENVGGLADIYHMVKNGDEQENILKFKGEILHSHVREPFDRSFPTENDSEEAKNLYKRFFKSLIAAGCETCAIESRAADFNEKIEESVAFLKKLIKECEG